MNLLNSILAGNLSEANSLLKTALNQLMSEKLDKLKLYEVAEIFDDTEIIEHIGDNVVGMGRTKLIRTRVRAGKIQKRIKKSTVKGFVARDGHLDRMTYLERMNRKQAARKSRIKRRSKLKVSLRKRSMSIRKRHQIGL